MGSQDFLRHSLHSSPLRPPASLRTPPLAPSPLPAGLIPQKSDVKITEKQAREADDAYLEGAKHVEHGDLAAAERSFTRAVQLNPSSRDYLLALADIREHRVTELVQAAARAHALGQNDKSDDFLAQARVLDPDNPVVSQHFGANLSPWQTTADPLRFPAADIASTLAGPIEFAPTPGLKDIHQRGDARDVIRAVYDAYGIVVTFDDSVTSSGPVRLDLENVDFATVTHILGKMTHVFAVPLQPRAALIAKDNQEQRERLIPQLEETIYLPGVPQDEMAELANVARNVFDLQKVTASASAGDMVIRGDEPSLKLVNATFADLLDGGSDVELDISLYELDKTHMVNIGAQLPTSASGLPALHQEAQNLVNANQSINQRDPFRPDNSRFSPTISHQKNKSSPKLLALIQYAGVSGSSRIS